MAAVPVRTERETGRDRNGKSPARSAGRERGDAKSAGKDRQPDRGGERPHKVAGESELEKAAGAKQKSRDFDLGMQPPRPASGQHSAGDDPENRRDESSARRPISPKSAEGRYPRPSGSGAALRGPRGAGRGQGYLGKARNSSVLATESACPQNPGGFAA